MIVYLELVLIWLVVTTVIYLLVRIYSRSVQREKLEKEFDANFPAGSGDVADDRKTFISEGLADYEHGRRRRLIGLIYVLPAIAFVVVIYVVNYR